MGGAPVFSMSVRKRKTQEKPVQSIKKAACKYSGIHNLQMCFLDIIYLRKRCKLHFLKLFEHFTKIFAILFFPF